MCSVSFKNMTNMADLATTSFFKTLEPCIYHSPFIRSADPFDFGLRNKNTRRPLIFNFHALFQVKPGFSDHLSISKRLIVPSKCIIPFHINWIMSSLTYNPRYTVFSQNNLAIVKTISIRRMLDRTILLWVNRRNREGDVMVKWGFFFRSYDWYVIWETISINGVLLRP